MVASSRMGAPTPLGLLLVAVATVGCGSVATVSQAPLTAGETRTFPTSPVFVLMAARRALFKHDIDIEKDEAVDARTWMLVGFHDVSAWSWGEFVRLVVWYSAPVAVTVYSERSLATNVTAESTRTFAEELFPEIDAQLYRLHAPYLGPPAPGRAPSAGSSIGTPASAASAAAPPNQ